MTERQILPTDTVRMLTGVLTEIYSDTLMVGVDLGAGTAVVVPRIGSYSPRVKDVVVVLSRAERMVVVGSLATDTPIEGDTGIPGTVGYVLKSGDTMTGRLYLALDPEDPLEAVTKQFFDAHGHDAVYVNIDGDTMTGPLVLSADATAPLEPITKQTFDAHGHAHNHDSSYVNVGGDTMTGLLVLDGGLRVTQLVGTVEAGDVLTATGADGTGVWSPAAAVIADIVTDPVLINWFGPEQGISPWEKVAGDAASTVAWYNDTASPTVPGVMRFSLAAAGDDAMAEWLGAPLPYGLDDLYRIRMRGKANAAFANAGAIHAGFVCYAADRTTIVDAHNTAVLTDPHSALVDYPIPTGSADAWIDIPANAAAYISGRADVGGAQRIPSGAGGLTNLVSAENSSFEAGTTGSWSTGGTVPPAISNSATHAYDVGTKSMLITWGAGGLLPTVSLVLTGLTVGEVTRVTIQAYVPTGHPGLQLVIAGLKVGHSSPVRDAFDLVTLEFVPTATAHTLGIWPSGGATAGQQAWVDDVRAYATTDTVYYADWDTAVVVAEDVRYWRPFVRVVNGLSASGVFDLDSIEIYRLDASVRVPAGVIATSVVATEAIFEQATIGDLQLPPSDEDIAAGGPTGWVWSSDEIGVGHWEEIAPPGITFSGTEPVLDPGQGWYDTSKADAEEFWVLVENNSGTQHTPGTLNGTILEQAGWSTWTIDFPCDGLLTIDFGGLLKCSTANAFIGWEVRAKTAIGCTATQLVQSNGQNRHTGGTSTGEVRFTSQNVIEISAVDEGVGASIEFAHYLGGTAAAAVTARLLSALFHFIPRGNSRFTKITVSEA